MTELEVHEELKKKLQGIEITKEQALLALDSIMTLKINELLLEGHFYQGKEFKANDTRYEYLALMLAYNAVERDIIREKNDRTASI